MITPRVMDYKNYYDFIESFYNQNKSTDRRFSYNYLAQQLDWPLSLFPDLLKRRKKLSINRCIQLGLWLKLDRFDLEYLLFLTLKENGDKVTKDFVDSKISEDFSEEHPLDPKESIVNHNLEVTELAVLAFIFFQRGKTTISEIVEKLTIFPQLTEEICLQTIDKAEKLKFIKKENDNFYVLNNNLERVLWGDQFAEQQEIYYEYSKIVSNFFEEMSPPYILNSGFLELPLIRQKEIFEKINSLKNWLHSISDEYKEKEHKDGTHLFVMNLQLFPLFPNNKN